MYCMCCVWNKIRLHEITLHNMSVLPSATLRPTKTKVSFLGTVEYICVLFTVNGKLKHPPDASHTGQCTLIHWPYEVMRFKN